MWDLLIILGIYPVKSDTREEMEKEHDNLVIVCATSAADTGARQDLGIRTAEEGGEEQGGA